MDHAADLLLWLVGIPAGLLLRRDWRRQVFPAVENGNRLSSESEVAVGTNPDVAFLDEGPDVTAGGRRLDVAPTALVAGLENLLREGN